MRTLLLMAALAAAGSGATVIDRVAVVAGKHAIKWSDIDRDLRVTEFLNREPLNEGAEARKKSAERLIDQLLIREELATGSYQRASEADARAMLDQLRKSAYGDSGSRMGTALAKYGLTEEQLRAQLVWQLTVLRFIDQRFRAGVLVTDDDARKEYDAHREKYKVNFETALPGIREALEGVEIDEQFEKWLAEARKRTRIEFHEEAFR